MFFMFFWEGGIDCWDFFLKVVSIGIKYSYPIVVGGKSSIPGRGFFCLLVGRDVKYVLVLRIFYSFRLIIKKIT